MDPIKSGTRNKTEQEMNPFMFSDDLFYNFVGFDTYLVYQNWGCQDNMMAFMATSIKSLDFFNISDYIRWMPEEKWSLTFKPHVLLSGHPRHAKPVQNSRRQSTLL